MALLLLSELSGCNFYSIKQDAKQIENTVDLEGEVTGSVGNKPVGIIMIKAQQGESKIIAYYVRYGSGAFRFIAAKGVVYLFAFMDKNEDQQYNIGEPAAWYGGTSPKMITVPLSGKIEGLNISLSQEIPEKTKIFLRSSPKADNSIKKLGLVRVSRGEVVNIDDNRFRTDKGRQGFFEPVQSALLNGYGIYFLEPYNSLKIPVLFVHGAGGCAQEFRTMMDSLDHTKFQPWVYQYPSGLRLGMSSYELQQALTELYLKYKFKNLAVIAHSMGGLVSRAAINEVLEHDPTYPLRSFISISTPWDGVASALMGVVYSPVVIPAWMDIVPNSPFINKLFSKPLSPTVNFYLFFGVVGGNGTDGTVPLTSEISLPAQEDAVRIYGFPEDHTSILVSPLVIERLRLLLQNEAWFM